MGDLGIRAPTDASKLRALNAVCGFSTLTLKCRHLSRPSSPSLATPQPIAIRDIDIATFTVVEWLIEAIEIQLAGRRAIRTRTSAR